MKKRIRLIALLPVVMLAACHDKKAVTGQNFKDVLSHYYASHCGATIGLTIEGRDNFPVSVTLRDDGGAPLDIFSREEEEQRIIESSKLDALADVGLLNVTDKTGMISSNIGDVITTHQRTYFLTEKGESVLDHDMYFCAGHYKVASIKTMTRPFATKDGATASRVVFTTSPKEEEEWVKNESVQAIWPELKEGFRPNHRREIFLILGKNGWVTADEYYQRDQ